MSERKQGASAYPTVKDIRRQSGVVSLEALRWDSNGRMFLDRDAEVQPLRAMRSGEATVTCFADRKLVLRLRGVRDLPFRQPMHGPDDPPVVEVRLEREHSCFVRLKGRGILCSTLGLMGKHDWLSWWISEEGLELTPAGVQGEGLTRETEVQSTPERGMVQVRVTPRSRRWPNALEIKMGTGLSAWQWLLIN